MELARSDAIPSFHDESFDGVWIPVKNKVHLFLTTVDNKRFTVGLEGVKALHLWNIREGNLDVSLIDTDQLTEGHIESASLGETVTFTLTLGPMQFLGGTG